MSQHFKLKGLDLASASASSGAILHRRAALPWHRRNHSHDGVVRFSSGLRLNPVYQA